MTQPTIEYFKAHHSDDLLNAIDKAYRVWYRDEFKKEDDDQTKLSLLHFLLEKCFFTNDDIYTLLALKVVNVWLKKNDLYYDSNRLFELQKIAPNTENEFGSVHLTVKVELKNLPKTVEEYIVGQTQLKAKYITEVAVTNWQDKQKEAGRGTEEHRTDNIKS